MKFEEMSKDFKYAFGHSNGGYYRESIPLYEKVIQQEPNNFAAINNYGVAKIYVGIEDEKEELIKDGILQLKKAIEITKNVYGFDDGYPIAEGNLKWAEGLI